MNRKSIYMKLLSTLLATTLFYGCSKTQVPETSTEAQTEAVATNYTSIGDKDISNVISELVTYDNEDYYSDWKNESPNYIQLNGTDATITGSGAEVKDGKITIKSTGVYVVSGKLDNGQILVDVADKGTVKLVLNGAEINSSDNAPIYVMNAGKAIISLEEGTENIVSDGEKYVLTDGSGDEPSAAIFSKDNLIINGKGKLTVHGNYNDGIASKDDLKIIGGNIEIHSVDDGLIGKDMVAVKDGNITIEAGGDGVKTTNDTEASKGFIAIEAGTFNIKASKDGMQGESYVLVAGGSINIESGGGSVNGVKKTDEGMKGQRPGNGTKPTTTPNTNTTINNDTNSNNDS
ncbi:MAG: carbohydrate-binding domain-containing protein [Clostridium sp.]